MSKNVTLTKGDMTVETDHPREIAQLKAEGFREGKPAAKASTQGDAKPAVKSN